MNRVPPVTRRGFLAVVASVTLLHGPGCGPDDAKTPNVTAQRVPKIGVVLPMFQHPFFLAMRDAIEAEAKKLGIVVDIRDGQDDDQKQILQVEALLGAGVDAIVLCPRDEDAAVAGVEAANRAKVPVVTVNRRVNGGTVVAYIGADDADGGRSQGKELIKALGADGGKIIYLQGTQGSSPQIKRNKGLREILDANPKVTIAADVFTDFQEDKAKAVMSGLVQRFKPGEIRAIVAQADELALPAAEVARAAGWKDLVVIGFNGTKGAFEAIKAGGLHATILQDPAEQGRFALDAAFNTQGRRNALSTGQLITELPVVTRENVEKLKPSY